MMLIICSGLVLRVVLIYHSCLICVDCLFLSCVTQITCAFLVQCLLYVLFFVGRALCLSSVMMIVSACFMKC